MIVVFTSLSHVIFQPIFGCILYLIFWIYFGQHIKQWTSLRHFLCIVCCTVLFVSTTTTTCSLLSSGCPLPTKVTPSSAHSANGSHCHLFPCLLGCVPFSSLCPFSFHNLHRERSTYIHAYTHTLV